MKDTFLKILMLVVSAFLFAVAIVAWYEVEEMQVTNTIGSAVMPAGNPVVENPPCLQENCDTIIEIRQ